MSWNTWAVFAVTVTLLCLTPGPAVLFVVAQALRFGGRRSLWATAGILVGNALYFALGAAGLGAVLLASHRLYLAVRYVGAFYLIYLGVTTFFGRGIAFDLKRGEGEPEVSGWRLLGRALLVQLSNPKAILFVTAFVPQFLDAGRPLVPQLLILGVTGQLIEVVILGAYGAFAGAVTHLAHRPRFAAVTQRVSGALLVAIGVGIAFAARGGR
jgi:homoserine/homoserine lactone efflux protein